MLTIKDEIDLLKNKFNNNESDVFNRLYENIDTDVFNIEVIDNDISSLSVNEKIIFLNNLKKGKNYKYKLNYFEKRLKNYKDSL